MPFASRRQARWMFANHPEMAKRWADHTPDFKALPESVDADTPEKKGFALMATIPGLAKQAADFAAVEKLASDTQITPDLVCRLASRVNMSPAAFTKAAYADPADYTIFLGLASGVTKAASLTKGAAAGKLVSSLLQAMRAGGNAVGSAAQTAGKAVAGAGKAAVGAQGAPQGGFFGTSTPQTGVGRFLGRNAPLGKSQAGRAATGAAAAGGIGGGGAAMMSGKPQPGAPEQAGAHEQAVNSQVGSAAQAPIASPQSPAQMNGPAPNPQQQGGMGPAGKALVAAGGVGLGALGVGAMARKRKQQAGKQVTAADAAKDAMRAAIVKKAAELYRKEAATKFVTYLDKVAAHMTLEKAASVRQLQAAVAAGKPLSHAIKLAYPTLTGEQRGILASRLVKAAVEEKRPFFGGKSSGRQEASVKMKDGAVGKMKAMSC